MPERQQAERNDFMRKTTEITRAYQLWYMVRREAVGLAICAFVEFMLFVSSYSNDIFRIVSGVFFTVINGFIIYDGAASLAKLDRKSYTPLNYDVKQSFLWGCAIGLLMLLWVGIFYLNRFFGITDGVVNNPISVAVNVLFYMWQSPYLAFLINDPATVPVWVAVLGAILPCGASVLGYISGKSDFAISAKLRNLMFEKED